MVDSEIRLTARHGCAKIVTWRFRYDEMESMMKRWLYLEFWWAVHNLFAHPVSQLVWWLSLCGVVKPIAKCGDWIHDQTIPKHNVEEGRG